MMQAREGTKGRERILVEMHIKAASTSKMQGTMEGGGEIYLGRVVGTESIKWTGRHGEGG